MRIVLILMLMVSIANADILPVKNSDPKQYDSLTKQEVAWMYAMKTRFWEDGTRIIVYYQSRDSDTHKRFCKIVLGIDPSRFDTMLDSYLNTGNASYFRQAKNEQDVYNKVSLVPGAIGYLDDKTMLINGGYDVRKIIIAD